MSQKRPRMARPSSWSDGPTWGSRPFNRITGARRAIVAPVAGTTRDAISSRRVAGHAVHARRHGRAVRRQRGPAARARRAAGAAGARSRPISLCSWWMAAKGWCPATRRSPASLRSANVPVLLAVNKTDDKRAQGPARSSSISWASSRSSRFRPSTARARATCSTKSSSACRRNRTPDGRSRAARKSRSPSSAGRTSASRRCSIACCKEERVHRQRHAGHDARRRRRRAHVASPALPHRRHRRHPAAGPGRAVGPGRSASASSWPGGRSRRPTWPCWSSTRSEGATDQDAAIGGEAERAGRGIVIVANKWDLVKGAGAGLRRRRSTTSCGGRCKFLDYAPDPPHLGG